ncbi:MAG: DUF3987 domain-containing protein [Tepidisphaeraceae bacterium]
MKIIEHAPSWIANKLRRESPAIAAPLPDQMLEGEGRNNTLTSLAGTMRRRGANVEAISAALREQNKIMCVPPLPDAEVIAIANSIGRYAPADTTESKYPWKPFPIYLLPLSVREFVRQLADAIGCDPAMIALPLLSSLASAIGGSAQIELRESWIEVAIIWSAIIARSGCKKSPAMRAALRGIAAEQKRLSNEYAEKRKIYENEFAEYNAMEKSARPVAKPQPPTLRHVLVSDITLEALADRLQNSCGLLLGRDELSGWVKSFGEYKGGKGSDVQGYLSMFSAAPLKVDRKTGDQTTIFIERPNVSITGTIQPEILKRVFTQEFFENGLAARFLFAIPPEPIGGWTDTEMDFAIQRAVDQLFESLYARAGTRNPQTMIQTADALELFKTFVNGHSRETAAMYNERLRAAWSKLEGYCARFALVLQVVADTVDGRINCNVSASVMQNAIELTEWFKYETRRVYSILHGDQQEDEQNSLIGWIYSHGGRIKARDLVRNFRQYRSNPAAATAALQSLVDDGLGRWEYPIQNPRGGAPSPTFVLGKTHADVTPLDAVSGGAIGHNPKLLKTNPPSAIPPSRSVVSRHPQWGPPPRRKPPTKPTNVTLNDGGNNHD